MRLPFFNHLLRLGRQAVGPLGNVVLRGLTIGTRSLLVIALAAWLEPKELGYFGLITAIVSMTNYIFGLDFYTFVVRDISLADVSGVRCKLRDQFLLHGLLYVAAAGVLWHLLPTMGQSRNVSLLVILVAILQHATLELYRILVRLHRVIAASLAFFVRDAGWIPLCLLHWWITGTIDLEAILGFWLLGSVACIAYSLWDLGRATPKCADNHVDWQRLRLGLQTGLRMLPGTLSLRAFFSVDRMILAVLVLPDTLGAYVFYTGLCLSFHGLFESGVLPYFWPPLLEAQKRGDRAAVRRAQRKLNRICWFAPIGVAAAAWSVGFLASRALSNPVYAENLDLLSILVFAYALLGGSNAPHYALYSKGLDWQIVVSQVVGLVIFVAAVGMVSLLDPRLAVPVGLVIASGAILLIKAVLAHRARTEHRPLRDFSP